MSGKTPSQFKCYYCTHKVDTYSDIVDHCVQDHTSQTLKYRELILLPESGQLKYQTKSHEGIVPIRLENEGKLIEVRGSQIYISRNTPKRKKLNTPVKDTFSCKRPLSFESEDKELFRAVPIDTSAFGIGTSESSFKSAYDELIATLPGVLEALEADGHLESFLKYTRLLSRGKIPKSNICYLLFLDLVDWYSTDNTSRMRYRPETIKFWQIGYRLFHGKFLRFMAGPRHAGHVLTSKTEKGYYDPYESKINFPVPSKQNLYGKENIKPVLPGICIDAIQSVAQVCGNRPMKLAVDGKKICRGKGKLGDVDLWGFEAAPSLSDRKESHLECHAFIEKAKANP